MDKLTEQDWLTFQQTFKRHLARLGSGGELLLDKHGNASSELTEIWKQKLRDDIEKYKLLLAGIGEAPDA